MMTSEDFVLELDSNDKEKQNFKLAQVVDLFENETAKVQFDGEETPSEKQYAYLTSYIPSIGDRVLLAVTGGTYIMLGKISFDKPPETEIDRYLFDLKIVSILKGLDVSGAAKFNNGIDVTGNLGVKGEISSNAISVSGALTATSAIINGAIQSTSATLDILEVTDTINGNSIKGSTIEGNSLDVSGTSYLGGTLRHGGYRLGFFGRSARGQNRVNRYVPSPLGSEPTLSATVSKLNELIEALQDYGLINGS